MIGNIVSYIYEKLLIKKSDLNYRKIHPLKISGINKFDSQFKNIFKEYEHSKSIRQLERYPVLLIIRKGVGISGRSPMVKYLCVHESEVDERGLDLLLHALVYRSYLRRLREFGIHITIFNRKRIRRIFRTHFPRL